MTLVTQLSSYLKDTGDFISVLTLWTSKRPPQSYFWLLWMLSHFILTYHMKGLEALRRFLDLRASPTPPTQVLISVANLALTRNYFLFNEQFYLQSQGVSMGSSFGPDYANLFIRYLEHCSVFNNNTFSEHILLYKLYMDDCFLLWRGSLSEFDQFA